MKKILPILMSVFLLGFYSISLAGSNLNNYMQKTFKAGTVNYYMQQAFEAQNSKDYPSASENYGKACSFLNILSYKDQKHDYVFSFSACLQQPLMTYSYDQDQGYTQAKTIVNNLASYQPDDFLKIFLLNHIFRYIATFDSKGYDVTWFAKKGETITHLHAQ